MDEDTQRFDVIIIGAGAAGLMCAGEAQKRGRRVLVIDKAAKVGEKIRISGGGRANFTNLYASPANYLSENPHFCVSALKRYSQHDFIALVEQHSIAYHERDHGQLFCEGTAQQITGMLLDEARDVRILTSSQVSHISKDGSGFAVETDQGNFTALSLVIATGGPSIPKMGASGFGYDVARQFGLKVIEPRAGLVPLTFDTDVLEKLEGLAGVSLDAEVKLGKIKFTEGLLFTHQGISGPVILQISSYWQHGDTITINLLPDIDVFQFLKEAKDGEPKKEVRTALAHLLPKRLAQKMVDWAGCDTRLAETSDKALRRLGAQINAWALTPKGSEGMRTAEVTVGGVDTKELSSKTMEANAVPGLYFIGEVVDVTGHLGGYNFQWAWASGHACGQVA
ncbi:MAG: NAD(P)/FAD-dependent oxidoreductase [Rhodospirillaceae bacterium]|jgi:predicted Rossmann fold flavoprotein|nr:NAD(P)/FAD-dependent oxidoreductase [Rhodospirillaceae bacterium]MBT4937910.1 NAD(P)/FAD-dependent oxidoreductase [Rhodospirillaceae bacterium]MBT5942031.1 NAD(P)/FAD-dependent oxidoreductase [Rhodospirillaceae bacterium]MBT7269177.1 NAD(P)/FAD-dependent oxidoreductase [Rhodospirillaceae bacterium]